MIMNIHFLYLEKSVLRKHPINLETYRSVEIELKSRHHALTSGNVVHLGRASTNEVWN